MERLGAEDTFVPFKPMGGLAGQLVGGVDQNLGEKNLDYRLSIVNAFLVQAEVA